MNSRLGGCKGTAMLCEDGCSTLCSSGSAKLALVHEELLLHGDRHAGGNASSSLANRAAHEAHWGELGRALTRPGG
eukprot:5044149-Alexandrium_andersonii.AAC.1